MKKIVKRVKKIFLYAKETLLFYLASKNWAFQEFCTSLKTGRLNDLLELKSGGIDQTYLISLSRRVLQEPTPQALRLLVNRVARYGLQDVTDIRTISSPDDIADILLLLAHCYTHAALCVSCVLGSKRIPAKQLQSAVLGALPKSKDDDPCFECIDFGCHCQQTRRTA